MGIDPEKQLTEQQVSELIGGHELLSIIDPEWDKKGRVHDWRNYIPLSLQRLWKYLSFDARAVAYFIAEEMANNEEWD